jgi:serine/threonine protein kinase/Flp pilus assembly protein TadD
MENDPFGFAGKTFDENLEIKEYVDAGGMAIVYRAWHKGLEKDVALKILKPEHTHKHPELAEKFRKEGAITHSLQDNPHIVRVIDAKTIRAKDLFGGMEHACLVMEWLEGRTLRDEIESKGALSQERIVKLFEQLCKGVAYAHNNNIIHLDLKPGNIMLVKKNDAEEMVKILDFGLAKILTPDTLYLTSLILTPEYSAPEQLEQRKVGVWSDIYSLGVMLYQMFTGNVPFDGDSVMDIINKVVNDPPPLPSKSNPAITISPAVEAVILKALEKKPELRYQTVTEFAEALKKAIVIKPGRLSLRCHEKNNMDGIAGASVYLNAEKIGEADERGEILLDNLQPGEYALRIEHIDYQYWSDKVKVSSDDTTSVTAGMERKPLGSLLLVCRESRTDAIVPEAVISLDGDQVGKTNESGNFLLKTIQAGKHRVSITHPDYPRVDLRVEIESGGLNTQNVLLEPKRSSQARSVVGIGAGVAFVAVVGLISWYVIRATIPPAVTQLSITLSSSATQASPVAVTKDTRSKVAETAPRSSKPAPDIQTSASSANRDSLKALIESGERFAKAGRYREALNAFKKVLKLKPKDPLTMNDLAIVATDLGDSSLRRSEFGIAGQAYRIALQAWNNDAKIHSKLGDAQSSLKQYDRAIKQYTDAIHLGMNTADNYCRLGNAYYRTGKYNDARLVYLIAIEIDERHKQTYIGLGRTYLKLNQKDAARKIQQKLQSLDRELAKELFEEIENYKKGRPVRTAL